MVLNRGKIKALGVVGVVAPGTLVGSSLSSADPGFGGGGFGRDDFPHVLEGTVTAVSAGSLTLSLESVPRGDATTTGAITVTADTTAATRYFETGSPVAPTEVAVGEHVLVIPAVTTTRAPDGDGDADDQGTLTASVSGDSTTTAPTTSTTAPSVPSTVTASVVGVARTSGGFGGRFSGFSGGFGGIRR